MMEHLAQRVKESVRLADVLSLYHLQPDRAGFLHCPFHSGDRSPSLKVYPDQNTWHCFGCGKSGTVIDFVMEMERCSFVDALKKLDADFHLGLSDSRESYRNYRKRLSQRRREEIKRKSKKDALDIKIAHRRALWLKIKSFEVSSHEQAQQAAGMMGQIELLDEQISQYETFQHEQIPRAASMNQQQTKARNSFGTFSEST